MNLYYFLAILAVFFWSFNVIIGAALVDILTPWQIAFFRWIIAAVLILPITIKSISKNFRFIRHYKKIIFYAALFGITISNTCVYYAAQTVQPVTLSLIGATGPLFLLFWNWLFCHAKLTKQQLSGLFCTLVGVGLIVLYARSDKLEDVSFQIGDLWMLGTAITFGFYSFLVSKKPKTIPQFSFLSLCICLGTILTMPMFIYDCFSNPLSFENNLTFKIILILLFLGVFSSFVAYLCWNRALEKSDIFKVGLTYYLMPVFSTVEAWLILGEKIHSVQWIGATVIFSGIFLSNYKRK